MSRLIQIVLITLLGCGALLAHGEKKRLVKPSGADYIEKPYSGSENLQDHELGDRKIGTIWFSVGSHTLTPRAVSKAAELANILINDWADPNLFSRNYRIKIIGFADAQGGSRFNLQLGLLRAEAVAAMLEKLRVPMTSAVVASHGKSHAYYKSPKYRRVEVWLETVDHYDNRVLIYAVVFFVIIIFLGGGFYLVVINSGRRLM